MKLIVKNAFRDKTDHVTVYEAETILDVKDEERAADLVERGLCAEYRGRKAASVTLSDAGSVSAAQIRSNGLDIPEASSEEVVEEKDSAD